jgi:hypothetical protein
MKHTKTIQAKKRLAIKRGVASRGRAFPRSAAARAALLGGCALLVLIVAAVAARDAIEKWALQHELSSAFGGGDASIARFERAGDVATLDGVSVQTPGGSLSVTADRVVCREAGNAWDVRASGLRATVAVDRLTGGEGAIAHDLAQALGAQRLVIRLAQSSVTMTRGGADGATLDVAHLDGSVVAGERPTVDLHGDVVAGARLYPFTAAAGRWTAAALPLAPLAALLGSSAVRVDDGEARDVAFDDDAVRGTLTLDGVRATIAGRRVSGLSGPLTIVPDGLGSTGLDAVLDDTTPVAAVGEVHDGGDWGRIAAGGTRDLRALGRMFALIAAQSNLRWMNVETTAPGITFGQYAMSTAGVPHVVQLLAVDPSEPTVHVGTALAGDRVISTGARTSDLGLRTHAVAGVNGDYFDIGRTYEPQGLLIREGILLHGPTDHEAVVFDRANHPTFARFHLDAGVTDGARSYPVTLFNSWPTRDATIITPDFGKRLPAAPGVTFAALEPLGGTRYRVAWLRPMTAPLPVRFGLGFGPLVREPLPRPGDEIDLQYAIDPPVPGATAGIGSGPLLLKDGAWYEDRHAPAPDERNVQWPVVAVGTMPDGTLMFVAVDGRHPERSIGMTRPEFGDLLRGYGMVDAMALDSGGSVTMVSRAPGNREITVRNTPSDFSEERYVSDALFVYSSAPLGTIVTAPRPHVEPTPLTAPSR